MSIKFDPKTGELYYQGKVVGECKTTDGKTFVRLNIEYEGDDWIVPLSWISYGLSKINENIQEELLLTIETSDDCIAEEYHAIRFLTEKDVNRGRYVWRFHKSDKDKWPSDLHGHDYEYGLKLDVLTGYIYDVVTRERCKKLKKHDLIAIQNDLRSSKDFKDKVANLIDGVT